MQNLSDEELFQHPAVLKAVEEAVSAVRKRAAEKIDQMERQMKSMKDGLELQRLGHIDDREAFQEEKEALLETMGPLKEEKMAISAENQNLKAELELRAMSIAEKVKAELLQMQFDANQERKAEQRELEAERMSLQKEMEDHRLEVVGLKTTVAKLTADLREAKRIAAAAKMKSLLGAHRLQRVQLDTESKEEMLEEKLDAERAAKEEETKEAVEYAEERLRREHELLLLERDADIERYVREVQQRTEAANRQTKRALEIDTRMEAARLELISQEEERLKNARQARKRLEQAAAQPGRRSSSLLRMHALTVLASDSSSTPQPGGPHFPGLVAAKGSSSLAGQEQQTKSSAEFSLSDSTSVLAENAALKPGSPLSPVARASSRGRMGSRQGRVPSRQGMGSRGSGRLGTPHTPQEGAQRLSVSSEGLVFTHELAMDLDPRLIDQPSPLQQRRRSYAENPDKSRQTFSVMGELSWLEDQIQNTRTASTHAFKPRSPTTGRLITTPDEPRERNLPIGAGYGYFEESFVEAMRGRGRDRGANNQNSTESELTDLLGQEGEDFIQLDPEAEGGNFPGHDEEGNPLTAYDDSLDLDKAGSDAVIDSLLQSTVEEHEESWRRPIPEHGTF